MGPEADTEKGDEPRPEPLERAPEPVELAPAAKDRKRGPRIGVRTAVFGAAVLLLAVAVPVLSWLGWHWVKTGRTGVTRTNRSGTLGGGERLMPFTPTALVVLTKDDGTPVSTALFTLNHGSSGGSVTFVPLDTTVPSPAYGIDRLRTAFALGGIGGFTRSASQVLGLTFTDTVVLDPNAFAGLLAPVGPLTVDNPGYFTSGGTAFNAGTIQVAPSEAVAYLDADEARSPDTADRRLQAFLQAWFDAVKRAGPAAVVGEGDTGMGRYVQAMSKGPVDFEALPVTRRVVPGVYGSGDQVLDDVKEPEASRLLARAVPFPQAPPNARLVIRLLNGVDTRGIPNSIVQRLVLGGGQVALEGATRGQSLKTTELRYGDRGLTDRVKQLRHALGAGKLVIDDAVSDPGEVTVVLGRDLLENPPAPLSTTGNGG